MIDVWVNDRFRGVFLGSSGLFVVKNNNEVILLNVKGGGVMINFLKVVKIYIVDLKFFEVFLKYFDIVFF